MKNVKCKMGIIFLFILGVKAWPYTATNVAIITINGVETKTTNAVHTEYWKKGILSGEIKDLSESPLPLKDVSILLGTETGTSSAIGTYSISQMIWMDNEKATFTAEKGGYYKKQRRVSLLPTATTMSIFLCPKTRDIPNYTWKMVSFPVEPSFSSYLSGGTLSVGDDLGRQDQDIWRLYIWDEDNPEDEYLSKYKNPGTISLGLGYWFKYYRDGTISLFTEGTPTEGTLTIPLKEGWNMVGNPSVFRVNKDSLTVKVGTQTYPLGSKTEDAFWGYDEGYNQKTTLLPHYGYWIRALSSCELVFPLKEWDDDSLNDSLIGVSSFGLKKGYVKIFAKSYNFEDSVVFGISPDATDGFDVGIDLSKPPQALGNSLSLEFINNGRLARDIRRDSNDITFDLRVLGENRPIQLSFEGIEQIDKEYNVFLIDGGNVFDLRRNSSLTLNSPRSLKIRVLKEGLIVQENTITKLITYPNPSDGNLTFYIALKAKNASFKVRIYNIVGQKVYEGDVLPSSGKSWERFSIGEQAYIYESQYDGRGSHNLPLASGLYIYEIRSYTLNTESKAYGKLLIKK